VSSPRTASARTTAPTSGLTERPPYDDAGVIDSGAVLAWGAQDLRDLPWRRERDPWRILVAEVMLQQTQVDRVVAKWRAFLDAFPTPSACAEASLADVLRLWQGLGYPRRARNLHTTSVAVVEEHGGRLPDDLDALLALPGIGPYTARAVLTFAFERDVAVVDTNIARILARTAGERLTPKRAQAAADELVPVGDGWLWNQVFMDLGATVCRPVPACEACPLSSSCAWFGGGRTNPDPAVGSAGVSTRQATFEGSDRQARGRVLKALGSGPQPCAAFDPRIVDSLVADGLVTIAGNMANLPT
jgi:A/G-specific adenine glycosylase